MTGIILGFLSMILTIGLLIIGFLSEDTGAAMGGPLKEAEGLVMSELDGNVHGNNPEAKDLAQRTADAMKQVRDLAIESDGNSHDKPFDIFCQLNPDSCAMIIRIPELNNYEDEAKELMMDQTWSVAQAVLSHTDLPDGSPLAVRNPGPGALLQSLRRTVSP